MVPEKVYWEEISPDGIPDPVFCITAYAQDTTPKRVAGLLFEYQSGACRSICDTTVKRCDTIRLQEKEKVVSMEFIRRTSVTLSAVVIKPPEFVFFLFFPFSLSLLLIFPLPFWQPLTPEHVTVHRV